MAIEMYLTDVMGTTTPKSEIGKLDSYYNEKAVEWYVRRGGLSESDANARKDAFLFKGKENPLDATFIAEKSKVAQDAYKLGELVMDVYEDAPKALERIAGKVRIAVFTRSSPELSDAMFKGVGLGKYIEKYYDSGNMGKTTPEPYLNICQDMGVKPSDAVWVTDDAKEANAAVEAGIGYVYFVKRSHNGEQVEKLDKKVKVVTSLEETVAEIEQEAAQKENTEESEASAEKAEA